MNSIATATVPREGSSAYTLVNLAANYRIDKHVEIFGRIDNLFNRRYEEPIGFDQTGFGAYGGVRLTN